LIGAPDEIAAKLDALQRVGVDYVLLSGQGSRDSLRRFAATSCRRFRRRESLGRKSLVHFGPPHAGRRSSAPSLDPDSAQVPNSLCLKKRPHQLEPRRTPVGQSRRLSEFFTPGALGQPLHKVRIGVSLSRPVVPT
jgi:hypothetical protein